MTNKKLEQTFDDLILSAKDSILLVSPYALDVGLKRLAKKATAPDKTLITNNQTNFKFYKLIQPFLLKSLIHSGFSIKFYKRFSHAKFLVVDNEKLLVGSSNFGRHSFWCNEEICLLIEDKEFIKQFIKTLTIDAEEAGVIESSFIQATIGRVFAYQMYYWLALMRLTIARYVPILSK